MLHFVKAVLELPGLERVAEHFEFFFQMKLGAENMLLFIPPLQ